MGSAAEICLSGSGGQGLILAGIILAEAAVSDGRSALQTQSYGPEARGGASRSEVIISDEDPDYPRVSNPDILLAMSQEAYLKYLPRVREGGLVLLDSTNVEEVPRNNVRVVSLPITGMARDELGKELVANIVALGALVELTGVVSKEKLMEVLLSRVPQKFAELNRQALEKGQQAARRFMEGR